MSDARTEVAATVLPAATRVDPLPVRVDAADGQIVVHVGDRKTASAWGPALDDPDAWFLWNGHSDPYRISGGWDGAASLIEDRREELQRREDSLWHPAHGQPDRNCYVAQANGGAVCMACGVALGGDTYVEVMAAVSDVEVTWHYVCANCSPYFESDEEE